MADDSAPQFFSTRGPWGTPAAHSAASGRCPEEPGVQAVVPGATPSPVDVGHGENDAEAAESQSLGMGDQDSAAEASPRPPNHIDDFATFAGAAQPVFDHFTAAMHGAPIEHVASSKAWLHDAARGALNFDSVGRTHAYPISLTSMGLTGRDAAIATSYLNAMHEGGVGAEDALRSLGYYRDVMKAGGFAALVKAPKAVPKAAAATPTVHEEIASIESAMRRNRRAYNRNEQMQALYRELLRQRGQ